jgi:hypothetical protein
VQKQFTCVSKTLLLAVLVLVDGCQSVYRWSKKGAQPINWNGIDHFELPMKPDNRGRPTFPVRIMGQDTTALFDSGMELPIVARDLLTSSVDNSLVKAKVNGKRRETVRDVALEIGSASMTLHTATVDDASAHASAAIGAELLLQATIELDFQAGVIRISRPDAFSPPSEAPIPIEFLGALPTVQLRLNGEERKICAVVDTGFNGELAVTSEVLKEFVLPNDPAGGVWKAIGAYGETIERPALTPLKELQVGQLHHEVVKLGHAPRSGKCANLFGMGILYHYRVIFDLENRRLWLLPRMQ